MLVDASLEDCLASIVQRLTRSSDGWVDTELEQSVRNAATRTDCAVADPLHGSNLIGGETLPAHDAQH